ncbi:MAG: hypothetical protein ACLS20_06010 [Faecalimonas umbilicata]|uniref:hypothetical protein n=1 Tax=Faecalimonas umbilicata TaxID=1912855 RepID=UPI0039937E99
MPDMREKVKEYIEELEEQITYYEKWLTKYQSADVKEEYIVRKGYLTALVDIKNDLQSRLDEVI